MKPMSRVRPALRDRDSGRPRPRRRFWRFAVSSLSGGGIQEFEEPGQVLFLSQRGQGRDAPPPDGRFAALRPGRRRGRSVSRAPFAASTPMSAARPAGGVSRSAARPRGTTRSGLEAEERFLGRRDLFRVSVERRRARCRRGRRPRRAGPRPGSRPAGRPCPRSAARSRTAGSAALSPRRPSMATISARAAGEAAAAFSTQRGRSSLARDRRRRVRAPSPRSSGLGLSGGGQKVVQDGRSLEHRDDEAEGVRGADMALGRRWCNFRGSPGDTARPSAVLPDSTSRRA